MAGVFGLEPDVGSLLVLFFPALIAHGDVIGVAFGEEPAETSSRIEVETLVRPVFQISITLNSSVRSAAW